LTAQRPRRRKRTRAAAQRVVVVVAIAALIALAYWPGLDGFWGRDDFMQLAYARLIGSPWPLFVHDHYFPVPGSIFRPLGFASFWLWQALFGVDYRAHAIGDMFLHIAVALALYRVIRLADLARFPAALCALLFALHPVVLGTALWWSARFDLLATLFALVAVRAGFDYIDRGRMELLALTLLAALAALLSKETAAAMLAAIGLVWLRWAARDPANRATALRAFAALCAVAGVFFAWRWIVLGTAATGLVGDVSPTALTKGILDWASHLVGYLSFWARLDIVSRIAIAASAAAFVAIAGATIARGRSPSPRIADLRWCALALFLLPALLQAPIAALNAAPLGGEVSAVETAMQSRLYYFSIAGLVVAISVIVRHVLDAAAARWQAAMLATLVVAVSAFGFTARQDAAAYAKRSSEPVARVEALMRAVDTLQLPAEDCHVVVLGLSPPSEWSIYVSPDSIIKALSPDQARIDRCFFHSDYATFFHLMARGVGVADALPYRPHEFRGKPVPWLEVGDALVAYLDPPADPATSREGAIFLRYDGAEFREVADGEATTELR